MSVKKCEIVRCGACRFYTPLGRRGGDCSQFDVHVKSSWKVCSLAESPFQKLTQISHSEVALTVEPVPVESFPVTRPRFPVADPPLVAEVS